MKYLIQVLSMPFGKVNSRRKILCRSCKREEDEEEEEEEEENE